ncbi:MAG: hypothetical protein HY204_05990 [Nitrospirae bacterium]|nr:hypothetical protein [Nitrospirota bacterium]
MARFCLVWIVLSFLIIPAGNVSARPSAAIIAFDQLVRPHRPVRLEVRLVTGGLSLVRRPISGERIEFLLNDRSLGQTLTGGDGMAVKSFVPEKPGLYVITVRLVENPRYEADAAELYVACRTGSYPVFPVLISSTRTPSKPPAIPFSPVPSSEAMPEAAKVLAQLSNRYQILYIEAGNEALLPETREWLASQDFPSAPLFTWRLPGESAGRDERFVERLQDIRDKGFTNIPAGISRSAADAEGLLKMKIRAIIMAEEDDDQELPKGAKKVTAWKAVPPLLK